MSSYKFRPIILAGGSGRRLWPLSTKKRPKQFISLFGDLSLFEESLIEQMKRSEELTFCDEKTKKLDLVVAASYGGRWDIVNAINEIKSSEKSKITEEDFKSYLSTAKFEDPDLCIRTGNEIRVSNFLLWQLSYTEIFFVKKLWPDFNQKDFFSIIEKYQKITRKFGKI